MKTLKKDPVLAMYEENLKMCREYHHTAEGERRSRLAADINRYEMLLKKGMNDHEFNRDHLKH